MEHHPQINWSTMMAATTATAARAAMLGAVTAVAKTAVVTIATMTTSVTMAAAVTQGWRPQHHTDGSGHRHRHSQQSTKSGSGRRAETSVMAAAMAVVTMAENGGDSGGIDAAMAAGTDTDNNQLKAAVEGRQRWRWQ